MEILCALLTITVPGFPPSRRVLWVWRASTVVSGTLPFTANFMAELHVKVIVIPEVPNGAEVPVLAFPSLSLTPCEASEPW